MPGQAFPHLSGVSEHDNRVTNIESFSAIGIEH